MHVSAKILGSWKSTLLQFQPKNKEETRFFFSTVKVSFLQQYFSNKIEPIKVKLTPHQAPGMVNLRWKFHVTRINWTDFRAFC